MAYTLADAKIGYQPVSEISTTKKHVLGSEIDIQDVENGWVGKAIYVSFKASTAVAAGILLTWETVAGVAGGNPFGVIATVAATHGTGMGVPIFVNLTAVGSNAAVQYGWVLVQGIAPTLKTAVKPLAASVLALSATAGRLYITASALKNIVGARLVASSITTTTSLVNVYYNRANIQGGVA